ncbi:MAG TPA: VWA domain-containing protein [Bryobacteraceae bacterium]|nr:VWA domain-containing protein [Bryobacteraceae bacterium]
MRPAIPILCGFALFALTGLVIGQDQGPLPQPGQTVAKPKKPGDAGNTGTDSSASPTGNELPKIPSQYKKGKDLGDLPSFKTDVNVVTLDVAVVDNHGQFIPGIPAGNFRILEDNVPQQIKKVEMGQAPMTIAMVVEFSQKFQALYSMAWFQTQQLVWGFASTLKPEDYCAVIAYDIKPEILTDFTTDRMKIKEALSRLTIPAWREANMFDAVTDAADRMSEIEGRKAILLITSGIDTFSKITYDTARKKLQEAGVPVYSISLLGLQRAMMPAEPIAFLQADNELKTFARETGGAAFFPRFEGEYGQMFQQVQQALRSQYVLTYSPSNTKRDGSFRKIKVELVDSSGKPLPVKDEKGKPIKYQIMAKAGYKAPHEVE